MSRIPWYIWCSVIAVTAAAAGMHWDLSWHRSIGRDTFWTPAHIVVQFCGVLMGVSSAWLILATSSNPKSPLRLRSVTVWRFRGPLGSFIGAWGGLAMITAAPFDDWWHNAYGLDVKIFSPPHVLLLTGILMVQFGALILTLGAMNRAAGALRSVLTTLFLYEGATIVIMLLFLFFEYSLRTYMHTAFFYLILAATMPVVFTALAEASRRRWARTVVAAMYALFLCGFVWMLPLFPAEPKLGPVYIPVTHFVPPEFPLLLIVPAFLLDFVWPRLRYATAWRQATAGGAFFLAGMVAAQWPFAAFLNSPSARNAFFGTLWLGYSTQPTSYTARYLFVPSEASFTLLMTWALIAAILSTRLGLSCGAWMARVRR